MMWQQPQTGVLRIPTPTVAVQLAASLCIGMLVGIEREWANKDFGLRSFAFVSVLGMLSAHLPIPLACVAFAGVLLLIAGLRRQKFSFRAPARIDHLHGRAIGVCCRIFSGYRPRFHSGGFGDSHYHVACLEVRTAKICRRPYARRKFAVRYCLASSGS